jgi:hypothetical protein
VPWCARGCVWAGQEKGPWKRGGEPIMRTKIKMRCTVSIEKKNKVKGKVKSGYGRK